MYCSRFALREVAYVHRQCSLSTPTSTHTHKHSLSDQLLQFLYLRLPVLLWLRWSAAAGQVLDTFTSCWLVSFIQWSQTQTFRGPRLKRGQNLSQRWYFWINPPDRNSGLVLYGPQVLHQADYETSKTWYHSSNKQMLNWNFKSKLIEINKLRIKVVCPLLI